MYLLSLFNAYRQLNPFRFGRRLADGKQRTQNAAGAVTWVLFRGAAHGPDCSCRPRPVATLGRAQSRFPGRSMTPTPPCTEGEGGTSALALEFRSRPVRCG